MMRKSLKTLLVLLVAVFTLASVSEAAAKKPVRHRTKHSTRVSSSAGTSTLKKRPTPRKKTTHASSRAKSKAKPAPAKRKATTKPR